MTSLSGHSRRALVAATAAMTVAPVATAKKKKRKKKKPAVPPPLPPLAYAMVYLTEEPVEGGGMLSLPCRIFIHHPGSLATGSTNPTELLVPFATFEVDFTAQVQGEVVNLLSGLGVSVPAERVAVTLL